MQDGPPATLPPRDSVVPPRTTQPSLRRRPRGMAWLVVVSILVLVLVTVFVPRPDVVLQGIGYAVPGCVGGSPPQTVAATFTLFNRGGADGWVAVTFAVDDTGVASQEYVVLAHGTIPGSLHTSIADCASHVYALDIHYMNPS